ncbi:TM2 domain-containing protein [Saccharicrinis sp. FJH2]|uniref:TM2 domain-containing protein n=1 Tax=Saccharicrinis sp. FJH65 TaxID=3344659 RepID=UPI0035F4C93D
MENQTTYVEQISDKSFVATLLLCLFLGYLGVHRFYAGKIGTGILMLITGGGLGIWVLIDLIMIILGNFKDNNGRSIKN